MIKIQHQRQPRKHQHEEVQWLGKFEEYKESQEKKPLAKH